MYMMPYRLAAVAAAVFCLGATAASHRDAPLPEIKNVAVLDFENRSGQTKFDHLGKGLASMLATDLHGVPGVRLVEREQLREVINELNLQQTQHFDSATASRIGQLLGAQYLVLGDLSAVDPRLRIDTRVVRVETSEIVKAAQVTGREDRFFEMQQKLADELIDGLDVALSPEELERFRQQQQANRMDDLETALTYSDALALYDRGDYVGALGKMTLLLKSSPNSTLMRLTYERAKDKAAQSAKDKLNRRLRGLLRKGIG